MDNCAQNSNVRYYKDQENTFECITKHDGSGHAHALSDQWKLKPKYVAYEKRGKMYASELRMLFVSSLLFAVFVPVLGILIHDTIGSYWKYVEDRGKLFDRHILSLSESYSLYFTVLLEQLFYAFNHKKSIIEKITINTYLIPSKVCSNVTSPDTKYMVLRTSLMASELFAKHIGSLMIKGMASVDPSMVRKC